MAHDLLLLADLLVVLAGVALGAFLAGRSAPQWAWLLLGLGGLALLAFNFRLSWAVHPFFDFSDVYYRAGVDAVRGDHAGLRQLTSNGVTGFVNLPIVAYLIAPLGLLSAKAATAVFTLVGIAACLGAWRLLSNLARLTPPDRWLLAFLFLVSGPLVCGLKWGNLSYMLILPLAAGLALLKQGRSGWAAVLLAAVAVVKPPLMLFGVFFLLRRDWRAVLAFAATGLAAGLASLAVFGWDDNWHWFQVCILQFSRNWVVAFETQSINGFLYRLTADPGVLTSWTPYPPSAAQRLLSEGLTALLFLVAALAGLRRPSAAPVEGEGGDADNRLELQYLLVICLALVASPLSWSHYFTWLLMPAAFFLKWRSGWPPAARWLGWIAVGLVLPTVAWPPMFASPLLNHLYASLVASNLLLGGLVWFGLVAWRLAGTGGWRFAPTTKAVAPPGADLREVA